MNFEVENMLFDMSLNHSTAYQNLAMTLIYLCRFFVQACEQRFLVDDSSIQLRE